MLWIHFAVASLGWVTPGAATEGVTPIFFPEKKLTTFFTHHRMPVLRCHPYIFSKKLTTFFAYHCHFFVSFECQPPPPGGCHPAPFSPVRLSLTTILCKFAHNFFLRVSLPGGCHPGRSAPVPSLVTPLQFRTKIAVVKTILRRKESENRWTLRGKWYGRRAQPTLNERRSICADGSCFIYLNDSCSCQYNTG